MSETGGDTTQKESRITRRGLLVGGAIGGGLVVAWSLWPRQYRPNLPAAEGEHIFGPWLKIAEDGKVVVAIPQSEMGQGVYTQLAQVVAGELGADWRTVAVQPIMPIPPFANQLLVRDWAGAFVDEALDADQAPEGLLGEAAERRNFVVTAGSTSLRQFEQPCREAGAIARTLLCQVAASRWDTNWEACETDKGFVTFGEKRLPFAGLAAEAAKLDPPDPAPLHASPINALSGKDVTRLDVAAKVDGSASFAGDIRLPGMLYASLRAGPIGDTRLKSLNRKGASNVKGLVTVIRTDKWVAALGSNWWAANRALDLMAPVFETKGEMAESGAIASHLESRFAKGKGWVIHESGSFEATTGKEAGTRVLEATYSAAPAVHAPIETRSATAQLEDGRLLLWLATQAPETARQAAADAIGISANDVVLFPMMAGGSFGRNIDSQIAAQAAILAKEAGRPVQLVWSRAEDFMRDHYRPPAIAKMQATLGRAGRVEGYSCRISTPPAMREVAERLSGENIVDAKAAVSGEYDPLAIEGAMPPYAIPNISIEHFPADIPIPSGRWRGNGHNLTAFFREAFIDELAAKAGIEPLSYRMQMLVGETRLARCLTHVATLAGWDGGVKGSGNGLACHAMRGSYIALIASAKASEDGVRVSSITAVVDCGRIINPGIALQQIEGGIVFGVAQALGASTSFEGGLPLARRLRDVDIPRLEDIPKITVEFLPSEEEPGGIGELGTPVVAPAIANALFSAAGVRLRQLPLLSRGL
ncbi:MAG: molybdopterin cofactor-binding domain-containing protein [Sphingorhabdus sp.]